MMPKLRMILTALLTTLVYLAIAVLGWGGSILTRRASRRADQAAAEWNEPNGVR